MKTEYPPVIARFYDTIYHKMRDSVDNDYFLEEIMKTSGKVLEIGVGTGRLFTSALEQGSDIYGLDISESMLRVLLEKLPENQRFRISRQDIVDFTSDVKFDLAIAPFRVLMHVQDKADQLKAINNVYYHLQPGGRFIFDVFMPDLKQLVNPLKNKVDFEGEYEPGKKVRRIVSTSPELITQTIYVSFHMEWEENDGLMHEDWTFPMRYFFRYELEHLVERSQFSEYQIYGDYKGSSLNNDSKELIVICRK